MKANRLLSGYRYMVPFSGRSEDPDDHPGIADDACSLDALSDAGPQLTQCYYPYGANRGGAQSDLTERRYTGQYHESGLAGAEGLYYYSARWYDAAMGRFIQADTIVPSPGNPQSWNRYAYVYNNPVGYSDPSGHIGDPDRDYGSGESSFGNRSSHPRHKALWFAEDRRFMWATDADYRAYALAWSLGYNDDVQTMGWYMGVIEALQNEAQYQGQASDQADEYTAWGESLTSVELSTCVSGQWGCETPTVIAGNDGTAIALTNNMPPELWGYIILGWTLGNRIAIRPDRYSSTDGKFTLMHEYVHALQYRSGDLTLWGIVRSLYKWDTPHEVQARAVEDLYRGAWEAGKNLIEPWFIDLYH